MHDLNTLNAQNAAAEQRHADGIERAVRRLHALVFIGITWENEAKEVRDEAHMFIREIIKSYNGES